MRMRLRKLPELEKTLTISGHCETSRVISSPYSSAVLSRYFASTSRRRIVPACEPPPPPNPPEPPARSISETILSSPQTRCTTSRMRRPVSAVIS